MILNRDILIGIVLALLIATAVGGFNYWKKYKERKLDEVAELVYLYEKGELKREEVEDRVRGTPYYAYFLALTGASPSEVLKHIHDEDLSKLFKEKEAFLLYEGKKYKEALSKLATIKKEDFNYPSALLLRSFSHEELEEKDRAVALYEEIIENYKGSYFARIALARLLYLKGD
ncbi:hypothetical protein [Hydrogenivirga sp.]